MYCYCSKSMSVEEREAYLQKKKEEAKRKQAEERRAKQAEIRKKKRELNRVNFKMFKLE